MILCIAIQFAFTKLLNGHDRFFLIIRELTERKTKYFENYVLRDEWQRLRYNSMGKRGTGRLIFSNERFGNNIVRSI